MAEERFTPITGQFPDKEKIRCASCRYRDKEIVDFLGKKYAAGVTRAICEKYTGDGRTGFKPHGVLFEGKDCPMYEAE